MDLNNEILFANKNFNAFDQQAKALARIAEVLEFIYEQLREMNQRAATRP